MKQFSQIIKITELNTSKAIELLVDPFTLEPSQETSNHGTIYTVELNLTTTDDIASSYIGREFSSSLSMNKGTINFGNIDYPAKCVISKLLNHYAIKINCKQPYPII
jgi:hypothetical protein